MDLRESDKKIVSVWLEPEITEKGEIIKKTFICFNCGAPVCAYHGNVIDLIPGSHPDNEKKKTTEYICRGTRWKNQEGNPSALSILGIYGINVDNASFKDVKDERAYPEKCGTFYSFYFTDPKIIKYKYG